MTGSGYAEAAGRRMAGRAWREDCTAILHFDASLHLVGVSTRRPIAGTADRLRTQPPKPRSVPPRQVRARKPPLRDASVALASAGVLALLVFYALAAPTVSLSAKVGSVVPLAGSKPVVVGRVIGSDGNGVEGARIEARETGRRAVEGTSDSTGAFRVSLPGRCAVYTVSIKAPAQGSTVATRVHHRLCPGDALPVDARVMTQGQFLWVPGPR